MDVFEAIQRRRSVRAYDSTPVPKDVLQRVLEAGRMAPSAMNYQPWHFVVVTDQEQRRALSGGRYAKFLTQSPVVIVGLGDKRRAPRWHTVDTTIALQQMVLAATAQGLGTCWIGSFDEDAVKATVNVPEGLGVVAMLALGYPKHGADIVEERPKAKNRKELDEIVSYEKYGRK